MQSPGRKLQLADAGGAAAAFKDKTGAAITIDGRLTRVWLRGAGMVECLGAQKPLKFLNRTPEFKKHRELKKTAPGKYDNCCCFCFVFFVFFGGC